MGKPAKRTPSAEQIERERQALELRRAGVDFHTIAVHLGYSHKASAYRAVQNALRRTLTPPADDLRSLEGERLDRMHNVAWRAAVQGDLKAVDRVLRISDQRCRLFGLNAPTQHDVRVRLDEEQARLVVGALREILTALNLTEEQNIIAGEVVPRALRAIDGGANTGDGAADEDAEAS